MKKILPPTAKKVAYNTCGKTNSNIRNQTIHSIDTYKDSGNAILSERIQKLSCEWDTERFLETNAAAVVLLSSIIGYKKKKCLLFFLTGAVGLFLLQHALQGWCPPLPIARKLGVRTAEEINQEKMILKLKRGDFSQDTNGAEQMLSMAEK